MERETDHAEQQKINEDRDKNVDVSAIPRFDERKSASPSLLLSYLS